MPAISRILERRSFLMVLCLAAFSPGLSALAQSPPAQRPSAAEGAVAANSDAKASFTALKGLAGTWTGQVTTDPPNPEINGPIQVTMRVASRGNVVVHEIAPGGMPEPTMIYVEDDRLTLVHYCEAGNRPRLVAGKSKDPNSVDFHFVDISGSKSPAYLERFTFTVMDADHHTEDWTFKLPDNQALHAHFDLKRVKGSAPGAAQR
jgi:hypothetical protein